VAREVVVPPLWVLALDLVIDALARPDAILTGSGDAFEKLAAAGYYLRLNTAADAAALEAGARTVTDKAEAAERARMASARASRAAGAANRPRSIPCLSSPADVQSRPPGLRVGLSSQRGSKGPAT
jgi:hypothetical protein